MKSINLYFLALFIIFSTTVQLSAQDDGSKHRRKKYLEDVFVTDSMGRVPREHPKKHWNIRHEFGINGTALLEKVLRSPLDSANQNPFLLTYRASMRNFGFRVAGGGTYRSTKSSELGFRDSETRTTQSFDVRAGLDYRIRLGRKFSATPGLDFVWRQGLNKQVSDSGFDVIERISQYNQIGGGPSVNLAWWITPNFGILTEANFYYMTGRTETARRFKNFPELDDQVFKNDVTELRTYMPSSVFLVFKF
jgi:hypothetical protein